MIQINLDLSDFPEKDSIAAIAYVDGCDRACPSCHNPILQRKQYLDTGAALIVDNIRRYLDDRGLTKLVLSGGDPLHQENLPLTRSIIESLKDIDICIYTGAESDEIADKIPLSPNLKYIKGGRYLKEFAVHPLRTNEGLQLASANQFFLNQQRQVITKEGFLPWVR